MKKIILFTLSLIVCSAAFAQFGYKHKLDTVNGVEISYKIVHAKHFDKESPAQLRIKLKNLNSHDVNVKFSIEYSIDFTVRFYLSSKRTRIELVRLIFSNSASVSGASLE